MVDVIYSSAVAKLLEIGEPRWQREPVGYYALYGLSKDDCEELLRMALDSRLLWAESSSQEVWAPVHAWRALTEFRAVEAIRPLMQLWDEDKESDWAHEDLTDCLIEFGPAAITPAAEYLSEDDHDEWSYSDAARILTQVGIRHPESRAECVAPLADRLERFEQQPADHNAWLISALTTLKAVETAPLIERAYAANRVDITICGYVEDIQHELGLRDQPSGKPIDHGFGELTQALKRFAEKPDYGMLPEERYALKMQRKKEAKAAAKAKKKLKQAKQQRKRSHR